MADGTGVSYASVGTGRPLVYVMGWLSPPRAELGAAGGAGVLRGAGAGVPARALRPCRLRAVGGHRPAAVVGVRARAARRGRGDAGTGAVRPDGHVDGRARRRGVGGGPSATRSAAWCSTAAGRAAPTMSPPAVRNHVLGLVESHWGLGSDVLTDIFAPDADARDPSRVRPLPAGVLERGHRPGAAGAELRARRQRPARRRAGADAGGAPRRRPRRARRPGRGARRRHRRRASSCVLPGRSHLPYAGDRDELVARGPPLPRPAPAPRRRADALTRPPTGGRRRS